MAGEPQHCSEPDCSEPAAYRTKTKPTWCDDHVTAILRVAGLVPVESFDGPKAYRLTRCLACGCEAHYRFEYVLDQNAKGVATCRACYWRHWAATQRRALEGYVDLRPVNIAEVRAHAEANGFDYLGALTNPSMPHDPHCTKCLYCGRISAKRAGDIGWGCSCQTNPRRDLQTSIADESALSRGQRKKNLLKESELPAVDWWDHEENEPRLWDTITVKARREAAWRCPECDLRFTARVLDITSGPSCPDCSAKRAAEWAAELAVWRVTPVAAVPALAAAWADEPDPRSVSVGDHMLCRFRCPQGHHPRITPLSFLRNGCPSCRAHTTRTERLERVKRDPDSHSMNREIASQWHTDKNGTLALESIPAGSRRVVWWRNRECGHEWQATPAEREKRQRLRCPQCRTVLDSLAYHFPELADEWSRGNPVSAWHVRPTAQTAFTPRWVCSSNPAHVWTAPLASRAAGAGCPECRESGKSRVELAHHAAAERVFASASSGYPVEHEAFVRRARWLVDIMARTKAGTLVAIEYDGAYWHADKVDVDTAKSIDLLAAGYVVVRLREHPLSSLPIIDQRYTELVVHPTAPDPEGVIGRVAGWVESVEVETAEQ